MATALLRAVDEDRLSPSLISPVLLDQFERFDKPEIDELIARNWTRGRSALPPGELREAIDAWKKKLNPKVLAKADASRGRQVYSITCGNCHPLFGEGIALGPDLTGSNRADLGYLLENVLAPSAVVGKDYLLQIFTLKDGSTISGMVQRETPEAIEVAMPGGSATQVKADSIVQRREVPQSLMPAGLFETLPLARVADLVKYLRSPTQVPLPGEKPAPPVQPSSVAPPGPGVVRIEGESLVSRHQPTGGRLSAQRMTNFGPSWSENRQLWWTGGKPEDVLALRLRGVKPGTWNLTLFPTTARDYARIQVGVNGQLRNTDLYTENVLPGKPLRFEGVHVSPDEPLQVDVRITGKNPAALPRYMVGIDRFELAPAASD